jgi:hypothetical protein
MCRPNSNQRLVTAALQRSGHKEAIMILNCKKRDKTNGNCFIAVRNTNCTCFEEKYPL